jgi:hypothetical protein
MRPLIHHSSRLALPIPRVPRIGGFVSITYFQAVRLHTASAGCVDETFALPIGNNGEIKLRYELNLGPVCVQNPKPMLE